MQLPRCWYGRQVQRGHAGAPAAEHDLPVREMRSRGDGAHDGVVGPHASVGQHAAAPLGQAVEVLRRRGDQQPLVDMPVHRLVHGVEQPSRPPWRPVRSAWPT